MSGVKTMSGGGIIIQRNAVLLMAVTEPCFYNSLPPDTKAAVDAIDAKEPMSRTQEDCNRLVAAITQANGC
jgi:hypothetical protein